MINDITDFLPAYPYIENYEYDFLNPYDQNFYTSIFKKKEFYDEKLEKFEIKNEDEVLYKHQKIISRFFSSYTPYDQLLLVHEMGTGKTMAALGAIEQIKKENSTITGSIIIAKGDLILNNFKTELIKKFKDQYTPENSEFLTEGEIVARTNKLVKKFYNFDYTFFKMAQKIEKMNDEQIIANFSNKIFVIDEVHNVRLKEEVEKKTILVYKQIHRLLHIVKNCKILLMSGTPIKDSIEEFANILNLILPLNSQLPTDEDFIDEFFDKDVETNSIPIYSIKKDKVVILKNKIKGRVSYLKAVSSDVKKIFEGEKNVGNLKHFIVYPEFMSDFQSNYYNESYNIREGVFIDSRQASLFVFPDGSWGERGFSNKENIIMNIKTGKTEKKITQYTLSPALKNELLKNNPENAAENILKNLKKFSSKYAACIENILKADRKKIFVYNEYVKGSGGILFSLILELFGFEKAGSNISTKKKRYIIINNITTSSAEIKNLIKKYNDPENLYGEYINVIIGSSVISEGISFYDIQEEHILTPHWNYSETDQAIARGYRLGSHINLINAGIKPILKIYQYVSIPDEEYEDCESIDLKMYEISEAKDINIKNIEHLIKESAFDCALNYDRNHITGYDNQRECDYQSCDYDCYEVPAEIYKETKRTKAELISVSDEDDSFSEIESETESDSSTESDEDIDLTKFKKVKNNISQLYSNFKKPLVELFIKNLKFVKISEKEIIDILENNTDDDKILFELNKLNFSKNKVPKEKDLEVDQIRGRAKAEEIRKLLSYEKVNLRINKNSKYLDIGSGNGVITKNIGESLGFDLNNIYGVEISKWAEKEHEESKTFVKTYYIDGTKLPFEDQSLDLIF